ncbi:hypothetical protein D5S17_07915 [Pseudonocardiaceae bacterium YIM PH 21723]|nr:hypothetical protein D5S17_07915 [Pseudonocardiaceae bacterium YIM PH 21723]
MPTVLQDGLKNAWSSFATFVPKLAGFLLILLIAWLIAKGISKAIGMVLKRVGFDKLVERSGLGGAMAESKLDLGGLIVKLVYYFVLLIGLQFAFSAFGTGNPVSELLNSVVSFLPKIAVAIVLVLVAAYVGRIVRDIVASALGQRAFAPMLGTIAYVFIVALGVIAALNQMGIAITVTMPVLIAVLATVGGILIVGVGGGMIKPMQQRAERWLNRMDEEMSAPSQRTATGDNYSATAAHARQESSTTRSGM